MNNVQRKTIINELCKNIINLNASEFEHIGHAFVELQEKKDLIHRGLTIEGKPSGYTVDTFDDARTLVAEYSTEINYFKKPYEKICNDVKHAKSEATNLRKLYLISSQECDNSQWNDVSNTVKNELKDTTIEFYIIDKRRLAEKIIDLLCDNTEKMILFQDYLPSIKSWWETYQFSHNIPEFCNYIENQENQEKIVQSLTQYSIILLHGLSGVGKSYITQWYASTYKKEYENIFWVDGADLDTISSFSSIEIKRLGISCNLMGKFNAGKIF